MVDSEVSGIDGSIQTIIGTSHDTVGSQGTEGVQLILVVIVVFVVTGSEHVVAHIVEHRDDPVVIVAGRHIVGRHGLISSYESHLRILIGLIEIFHCDDTLLGNIQTILAATHKEKTAESKRNQNLFHITCVF